MGDTFWPMTSARLNLGDDIIKKLFVDQEPVLSRDSRQVAEFMVRGRYPIALGVNPLLLSQFQRQGLGKNLRLVHAPEMDTVNFGTTLWLVNKAPHPHAAKVFINWVLAKETQVQWAQARSRRIAAASASSPATRRSRCPRAASSSRWTRRRTCPKWSRPRTSPKR